MYVAASGDWRLPRIRATALAPAVSMSLASSSRCSSATVRERFGRISPAAIVGWVIGSVRKHDSAGEDFGPPLRRVVSFAPMYVVYEVLLYLVLLIALPWFVLTGV